ncbi:MAG: hypothetical protein FWH18_10915 [Marinilabiliaceae bacterium]|nr:hypothetical protein [Marinilabiliaceae bacterium]
MKSIIRLILLLATTSLFAQSDFDKFKEQSLNEFKQFSEQQEKDFNAFRDKVNADYADFLRNRWEEMKSFNGTPAPLPPEPIAPVVVEPEKKHTADPLPFEKIIPPPTQEPRPQPIVPSLLTQPDIPDPLKEDKPTIKPDKSTFSFLFYNTECNIKLTNDMRFSLHDISEQSVSQVWKTLSKPKYETLITESLLLRDKLNLSDWGYIMLLKEMTEKFFGKTSNEAVLMQMFILTQSGYKVRIARTNNQLALLVPSKQTIYEYSFLNIQGVNYYVVNKDLKSSSFYICNQDFPKEQFFSWQTGQPILTEKFNAPKSFVSKRNPEINVSVQTNQNLMDYYSNYPLTSNWDLYTLVGFSEDVKNILYPVFQQAINGKEKLEAAQILLSFVQTAFEYKTCAEQFGYERPFFPDENFYYPYNNCKHRATLFALLIKELLELDVVLLHYPGHLSPDGIGHLTTAVNFSEDVKGDHFIIRGKKFIVCDPTYIGANVGMSMDKYKNVRAEIIEL